MRLLQKDLPISSMLRKFPFWPVFFGGRLCTDIGLSLDSESLDDGNEIGCELPISSSEIPIIFGLQKSY